MTNLSLFSVNLKFTQYVVSGVIFMYGFYGINLKTFSSPNTEDLTSGTIY